MGKGTSASRERSEIGTHSPGVGLRHRPRRGGGSGCREGVREGPGEQATPEWGLGR